MARLVGFPPIKTADVMPVKRAAPDCFIVVVDVVSIEAKVEGGEDEDESPYAEEDGDRSGTFAGVGDGLEEHGDELGFCPAMRRKRM